VTNSLLEEVRQSIQRLSGDDSEPQFAIRRKIAKELSYDERGKPTQRKPLPLLARGAVLDRQNAMAGYTVENVKLICRACDDELQEARSFTG
jgi:hypothetical protein